MRSAIFEDGTSLPDLFRFFEIDFPDKDTFFLSGFCQNTAPSVGNKRSAWIN
jgi:hypothetical protein